MSAKTELAAPLYSFQAPRHGMGQATFRMGLPLN